MDNNQPRKEETKEQQQLASTESITTSTDGNFDLIEAGTQNRIFAISPGRKHKCNIPDDKKLYEVESNQVKMTKRNKTGDGKQDKQQDGGEEEETSNNHDHTTNGDKNIGDANGKKDDENERNSNKGELNQEGRSGRRGRGGRGGRKTEWKQIQRKESETYNFLICFSPKKMSNKDPDAEFQAVLSQIMTKSPGVTFQTEFFYNAASKDFFEVYENKGLITFQIFVEAAMQYNGLEFRKSLLNY